MVAAAPSTRGLKRTATTKKVEFFDSDDEFAAPIRPTPARRGPPPMAKAAPITPQPAPTPVQVPVSVPVYQEPEPVLA